MIHKKKLAIYSPKAYEFIGKLAIYGPKAYEFIGRLAIYGPKTYVFIRGTCHLWP